jgi:hypothetical protein
VRQKGEEQQHEDAADPDQKVEGHFRGVDLLLVHGLTLLAGARRAYRVSTVEAVRPSSTGGWLL